MVQRNQHLIQRRGVLKGAVAAGVALPFFNRSALGQAPSGTVRIWTFLSAEGKSPRENVLRALIDDFKSKHPNVQVVVESRPFQELETKFVAASAQRRAPDLVWLRDTFLGLVHDRKALANLDEVLTPEFKAKAIPDMYPVFVNKSVFDGVRTSLPLWPSPAQSIFYRKDALAEIGLESPPLKWSEFVPAAGKLTKGNRLGFGMPSNDNSVSALVNIISGFGNDAFDPATGRIDLTGPMAVEAAGVVRALVANGALSRTLLNAMGDDIQDQFAAGRFAMAQAFTPRFQQFRKIAAGYDPKYLAVSAWPSFGNRPPAVLLGPYWTVGMSAASTNKVAAGAFLEQLYSPEASMLWAREAGLVPDRRSVMSDPWFQKPEAAMIREFEKLLAAPGALTFPQRLPDITRVFPVLNKALQELMGTDEAIPAILARARTSLAW
jgi:multiple sugar transport system substrate-binding protein